MDMGIVVYLVMPQRMNKSRRHFLYILHIHASYKEGWQSRFHLHKVTMYKGGGGGEIYGRVLRCIQMKPVNKKHHHMFARRRSDLLSISKHQGVNVLFSIHIALKFVQCQNW